MPTKKTNKGQVIDMDANGAEPNQAVAETWVSMLKAIRS